MTFWQSPGWVAATDSIYPLDRAAADPHLMPWWREAWALFRRRRGYDVVLTMGVRESFAYALLCRIAGTPSRQIMTEVFIDAPRRDSVAWRVKTALYRALARQCLGIITNSSGEIDTNAQRFGLPRDRFRYVPLCTTIAHPEYLPSPDGPLLCAGRTLRDYPTLRSVIEAVNQPWVIVGGPGDLEERPLPNHAAVHREIPRPDYLRLLREARIVVLPLLPTERATGQVVLLEAMACGKPVITTRAPGTVDIVRDGENGFLAEPGDAEGIRRILETLLRDPAACERIGRQALADVLARHSPAEHTRLRLDAVRDLGGMPFDP